VKLPAPSRVPTTPLLWKHACRLLPARYQALECFERLLDPGEESQAELLSRLADLTAASRGGDLSLLDPSRLLFGAGAGWIDTSYTLPRAGRFSTTQRGAFYAAGDFETAVAEVRHHLERDYRREGITEALELDYRALRIHIQGSFHDIRGRRHARGPWSAIYAPEDYGSSQAFAGTLRDAGSMGLVYDSLRRDGGACAAVFDPLALRGCRHNTYVAFRWNGRAVTLVQEKRILSFHSEP
jgi:hypothetical protein